MHESHSSTSKPRQRRLIAIVLLAVALIIGSLVAWRAYSNRYIAGKITFQQFEPTYWPSDREAIKKVINDVYVPSGSPARYTELVLEMPDGSVIFEAERKDSSLPYACPEGKITNQTCTLGHTGKGEPYLLYMTTHESGAVDQRIQWSRHDTDITIRFENIPEGGYSQEDLEKVIQSFVPVEYKGLKVRHIDRSTI